LHDFDEGVGQVEHRLDPGATTEIVDREQVLHHRG